MFKKNLTLKNLNSTLDKIRLKNKKIVLCHGVFDFFHLGHLNYFHSAKKFGDLLIVSLTADKFVNKGINRPFYKEQDRLKVISSLEIVDFVILSNSHNGEFVIEKIKPDFYVKGPDYKDNTKDLTKNIYKENSLVKKYGGKVIYTNDVTLSSSSLINNYFNNLNELQKKHRQYLKKKYSFEFIKNEIEKICKTKVLVIGETIIDEYIFSESIGKSGKEPHLVIRNLHNEIYAGGIVAIANHLDSFTKNISIITAMGEDSEDVKFIKNKLAKNINFNFIKKINTPTIKKKRFIDKLTNHKLLGVYSINDRELTQAEDQKLEKIIFNKKYHSNDLTIISDYGHGFISPKMANKICSKYKNIFLNAQLNATNIGFHTLKNYNNFNSLIINESELRHEFKNRNSEVKTLIKKLAKSIKVKNIIVTRGANGAIYYNVSKDVFFETPAYASKIIDKVGAGDTLLAIFSICYYNKIPADLSLFIASLAASSVVESMGNSMKIDKISLLKSIEYFLK